MKTILKALWHDKSVHVAVGTSCMMGELGKTLHIKIEVADTALLPSEFARGAIYKANPDIINNVGGLPKYVARILEKSAHRESQRRAQPIKEQLDLF